MILRQPDDCSPWGIRRPACPPDDAVTDAQAAVAAAVEHAYLDLQLAGPVPHSGTAIPGTDDRPVPGRPHLFDDVAPTTAPSTPGAPTPTPGAPGRSLRGGVARARVGQLAGRPAPHHPHTTNRRNQP